MFRQEFKEIPATITPVHFVLDIDDTLASGFDEKSFESYKFLKWFKERNLVIHAIKPHILHPGVIEFIQYLFQIPNVRISFFSSGIEERNIPFVRELLTRSLGADRYEKVKDSVSIFSKNDLIPRPPEDEGKQFGLLFGNMKKDLNKTLKRGESLSSTVLIDDDMSYVHYGQEKNLLLVPFSSATYIFSSDLKGMFMDKDLNRANHIFYVAGMIKAALQQGREKLAETFQILQCRTDEESYRKDFINKQYFLDGLQELQKINPKLDFYGGEIAMDFYLNSVTKASSPVTCRV